MNKENTSSQTHSAPSLTGRAGGGSPTTQTHSTPSLTGRAGGGSAFRFITYMLRRFRVASALNMLGLVVAYTAFYLLMTQVNYNYSYNHSVPYAERVFRVEAKANSEADWDIACCRPIYELMAELPQVDTMSIINNYVQTWKLRVGEEWVEHDACDGNEAILAVFLPRLIDGQLDLMKGEHSIVIPASLAQKLFGELSVAGRTVFGETDTLTVRGVYEDFPENCTMRNYIYYYSDHGRHAWSEWSSLGFVRLHEGVDVEEFMRNFKVQMLKKVQRAMISDAMADGFSPSDDELSEAESMIGDQFNKRDFRLRPIRDTWFSGVNGGDKGNRSMLLVLELAALLVIVIAAINFLNFSLAEAPMRIKSVNTRRVLGESITSLRLGMVGESILLSLVACGLALGLCAVLLTEPTDLLLGSLGLEQNLGLVALMLAVSVGVGIVAGCYPAVFATSFQPAMALKGSFGLTPKGKRLRTALICLQLVISLMMVTYIGVLYLQSHFIYTSDYGYDKDEVFYAYLGQLKSKRDAIRSELMQLSGVEDVSYSRFVLGVQDNYMGWGRGDDEHVINFSCLPVDWHYLRTMGIKVVEGRDFNQHDGDCFIINEAAKRQWPWVEIGKPLLQNLHEVIGVCEDIRFASVRKDRASEPLAFIIFGKSYDSWGDQLEVANIRVGAGVDKVRMRRQLSEMLTSMAEGEPVEVFFLDQQLEQLYQEEFRFIRQVLYFSLAILAITLIGVFCLTMFETEYRRKEIGLRKVMGASTAQVIAMLCRRYVWLLIASFVIASPLAWYFGNEWLQNFAERTPIHWWLFPIALTAVGAVTLLTVIAQSWRTANANPIDSIKTE